MQAPATPRPSTEHLRPMLQCKAACAWRACRDIDLACDQVVVGRGRASEHVVKLARRAQDTSARARPRILRAHLSSYVLVEMKGDLEASHIGQKPPEVRGEDPLTGAVVGGRNGGGRRRTVRFGGALPAALRLEDVHHGSADLTLREQGPGSTKHVQLLAVDRQLEDVHRRRSQGWPRRVQGHRVYLGEPCATLAAMCLGRCAHRRALAVVAGIIRQAHLLAVACCERQRHDDDPAVPSVCNHALSEEGGGIWQRLVPDAEHGHPGRLESRGGPKSAISQVWPAFDEPQRALTIATTLRSSSGHGDPLNERKERPHAAERCLRIPDHVGDDFSPREDAHLEGRGFAPAAWCEEAGWLLLQEPVDGVDQTQVDDGDLEQPIHGVEHRPP
mmetsp:Transcript_77623/g.217838  ORF Transcript_77623/g.217838 Transcript_77623/m.217838 type:complete len:388 (+) Transcript_77623:140-1303(+)